MRHITSRQNKVSLIQLRRTPVHGGIGRHDCISFANHVRQLPNFHIWLSGFSQGAALASLALAQCQNQQLEHKIQFAILAGAFLPKDPEYAHMMTQAAISIPTLFISGRKDQLIPLQRTEELIATFDPDSIQRYMHDGGHMVPTCSGDFKRCLQDFLDQHGSVQH
ncbi:TPA: hypothetical protein ACH3X3_005587 [Trebouxia sp. C0006]